eukprot:1160323-Pelagomonas_calceolata.AAC.1
MAQQQSQRDTWYRDMIKEQRCEEKMQRERERDDRKRERKQRKRDKKERKRDKGQRDKERRRDYLLKEQQHKKHMHTIMSSIQAAMRATHLASVSTGAAMLATSNANAQFADLYS